MSEENKTPAENLPPDEPPAQDKKPLSEKKKAALLRYMAVLFAVAFVLVLMSLVLQMRDSRATISALNETKSNALTNAEQLQEQNRTLQQDKSDLQDELEALQAQYDELSQENEDLKTAGEEAEAVRAEQEKTDAQLREYTTEAYDALLTAMTCTVKEGNVTYSKAMDSLKLLHIYLSADGQAAYEALLGE
jgi:DNA repair exonuclease SbcCD ATPase subunit